MDSGALLTPSDRARPAVRGLELVVAGVGALVTLVVSAMAFGTLTDAVREHDGVTRDDWSILRFFTQHRSGSLDAAARIASDVGAVPVLALLALAAGAFLWWRRAPLGASVAPVTALSLAGVAVVVIKGALSRPRPPVSLHLVTETSASFPSGHATDSAAALLAVALAFAVFLLRRPLLRWITVAVGAVATACVGLSRLVLGVHWPTDVVAGWALGTCSALAIILLASALARPPLGTPTGEDGPTARAVHRVRVTMARRRTG